jgi:hypothetical protein
MPADRMVATPVALVTLFILATLVAVGLGLLLWSRAGYIASRLVAKRADEGDRASAAGDADRLAIALLGAFFFFSGVVGVAEELARILAAFWQGSWELLASTLWPTLSSRVLETGIGAALMLRGSWRTVAGLLWRRVVALRTR